MSSLCVQDPTYLSQLKSDIAYARARGIEVGGCTMIPSPPMRCDRVAVSLRSQASNCADDLISDTRGGTGFNAIDPKTNQPLNDACFASGWNKELTQRVLTQMAAANLSSESATVGYCCRDLRVDRCCEQCSRRTGRTPATRADLTTTTTMTPRTAWRCSGAARPSSTL